MTQEINSTQPNSSLSEAQKERLFVMREANLGVYHTVNDILEKGYTEENKKTFAVVLGNFIIASNLHYTENDADIGIVQAAVAHGFEHLQKLLQHQPKPEVQTELPLKEEEKTEAQVELDLTKE